MATYIKTLKEDNGDITYPQTTADAVLNANSSTQGGTVQAFLDQAVIAEEIASTGALSQTVPASIIDWSSMPVVHRQQSFATLGSTNVLVELTRYGNLVFCNFNLVVGSCSAYDEQSSATCPTGYKPKYMAIIVGNTTAGATTTGCFNFKITNTGGIYLSTGGFSSNTRVQGFGVWITDDAMPSS